MQIKTLSPVNIDDAITAWQLSRDAGVPFNVIDAPVMEMPSALLNFVDFTIMEREIFCSLRNHVVWARTSRVDDPLKFTVPDVFEHYEHKHIRSRMQKLADSGVSQDDWRLQLPIVAHTSWTQRICLRDLVKLALYFTHLSTIAWWKPLKDRFADVSFELKKAFTVMLKDAELSNKLINTIGGIVPRYLNEKSIDDIKNAIYDKNDFTMVNVKCNIALRAQIVRHRELQFIDDFLKVLIFHEKDVCSIQLINNVRMIITARDDVWHSILSKRACWIAQTDLWKPILDLFEENSSPPLPCDNGICPYEADAMARLTLGNDPNPPCPVHMNLHYKLDKKPWREAMMKLAQKRGQFWMDQVNA